MTWLALLAVVASALTINANTAYPGWAAWWPCVGAVLLLWCGGLGGRFGAERVLEFRTVKFTGDISYSLYLWHYPIIVLASTYAVGGALGIQSRIELLALSYLISIASYFYIESPTRRWRLPHRHKYLALGIAVAMVACVWIATGLVLGAHSTDQSAADQIPGTAASVATSVEDAESTTSLPRSAVPPLSVLDDPATSYAESGPAYFAACDPYLHPSQAERPIPCFYGDRTASRTIVLIGDSTAGNWAPALSQGLRKKGYRLAVFGYAGCPAPDLTYDTSTASQYQRCDLWHRHLAASIKPLHPVAVIAVSGATDLGKISNQTWKNGYALLFREATRSDPAASRILMGTSPEFAESVPACLSAHSDPQDCSSRYTSGVGYYGSYLSRDPYVAAAADAHLVPTYPWFCHEHTCEPVIGRFIAFVDVEHLTIAYSDYLSTVVTDKVLDDLRS